MSKTTAPGARKTRTLPAAYANTQIDERHTREPEPEPSPGSTGQEPSRIM